MGIGNRIHAAMLAAGKKPVDIARLFQITESAVSQWFKKDTGPKSTRLSKLATFLNTTVDQLTREDRHAPAMIEVFRTPRAGALLRFNRKRKGLSVDQIADVFKVDASIVNQWEAGTDRLADRRLLVLLDHLNIDAADYSLAFDKDRHAALTPSGPEFNADVELERLANIRWLTDKVYDPIDMPDGSPEAEAVWTLFRYFKKKDNRG